MPLVSPSCWPSCSAVGLRPRVVGDVYERCGGNPFLVEEMTAAGLDRSAGRLPRRLRDILLAGRAHCLRRRWRCCGSPRLVGRGSTMGCCAGCACWRPQRLTPRCGSCSTTTSSSRTPISGATCSAMPSLRRPCTTMPCRASGHDSTPRSLAPSATIPTSPPPVSLSLRSSAPGTGNGPVRVQRHCRRGCRRLWKPSVCAPTPRRSRPTRAPSSCGRRSIAPSRSPVWARSSCSARAADGGELGCRTRPGDLPHRERAGAGRRVCRAGEGGGAARPPRPLLVGIGSRG